MRAAHRIDLVDQGFQIADVPVRLPKRLLAHLERWKRLGIARHAVVEWNGKPVASVRKSFAAAVYTAVADKRIRNIWGK
jgi:hypothetical protein